MADQFTCKKCGKRTGFSQHSCAATSSNIPDDDFSVADIDIDINDVVDVTDDFGSDW